VTSLRYTNEFDLTASTFCLQWVSEKLTAFRGIRNSLRPGGKMILVIPLGNPKIASLRTQMTREARWNADFVDYVDPSDCADDVQYETYAKTADFDSVTAFTDFLGALTPHLDRLPGEDEKRAFMEELVNRYLEIMRPARHNACGATYVYVCAKMVATAK
jgi:trans-aconitate methyltransferase